METLIYVQTGPDGEKISQASTNRFKQLPFLIVFSLLTVICTILVFEDREYGGQTVLAAIGFGVLLAATISGGLALYFIPAIVAKSNKKINFQAIFLLNIFLGWTLVGWVIALVWATMKDSK